MLPEIQSKCLIALWLVKNRNTKTKFLWRVMKRDNQTGRYLLRGFKPCGRLRAGGVRPVLIVQNDVGNKFSPTVIAAAITSQKYKTNLPTHIQVHANDCGLAKDSIVLLEQVRTLDKRRLRERMGNLAPDDMNRINRALSVSFGLGPREREDKAGNT